VLAVLATAFVLLVAGSASAQTTITVTVTGDDSGAAANCPGATCSLRDAILYANANTGTTIDLPAGEYDLSHGELDITSPVTITGLGSAASDTRIVQTGSTRVIEIDPPTAGQVSISDVEVTGGHLSGGSFSLFGAGIEIDPSVTGVGVQLSGDMIDHNSITASNASSPGLAGLTAYGGGVAIDSVSGPTVVVSATSVSSNTIHGGNGAAGTTGNGGAGGEAYGGGIYTEGYGSLEISHGSSLDDNTATSGAGGTAPSGHSVGSGGEAAGAGLLDDGSGSGPVSLTDTTVDGNVATGAAGATAVSGQNEGEGGSVAGAGLWIDPAVTLTRVEVDSNQATPGAAGTGGVAGSGYGSSMGAGAELLGQATIAQSTFAGNTGSSNGGSGEAQGGALVVEGLTTIVDSTITGNIVTRSSSSRAGGGGIEAIGDVALASDTIVGNSAPFSGANIDLYSSATVRISGTVVADPLGGTANCTTNGGSLSDLTTPGGNLEDDSSHACNFSVASGDTVGVPPQLGALANNGGATETMLPAVGSPLIGAAGACVDPSNSGAPLTLDERGLARPAGGPCDIGATQIQAPANTVAPSIAPTTATVGQSLSCNPGTWSGDGSSAYSYTWLRDGSAIANQSASSYQVNVADVNHRISCRVSDTSSYGKTGGQATSGAVSVTAATPSVTVSAPADGATYVQGQQADAAYGCASAIGIQSCVGPVANGAAIDTATLGSHSFEVTATDEAGQVVSRSVGYTVVPVEFSAVHQSRSRWRESGKKQVGTVFTFTLNLAEPVTLSFSGRVAGHRSRGKCAAGAGAHLCTLKVTGTVRLSGVEGVNTVAFKGRASAGKRLPAGHYTVTLSAPGAKPVLLHFTIVSGGR
jgi:CSLREA domain-containing protein